MKSLMIEKIIWGRKISGRFDPSKLIDKKISINTVCCNCHKVMSGPEVAHQTSHGLCETCAKILYPDIFPELQEIYNKA